MSTKPMKSTKYNRHYASKKAFPTVQGDKGGTIGHKAARRDVEQRLGRPLHEGTRIDSRTGNWVFVEPKVVPAKEE